MEDFFSIIMFFFRENLAPGRGVITAKFLRLAKGHMSVMLCRLFQASFDETLIPTDWKFGNIIPIPKSESINTLSNYRLISLTSIPCKIMEHIIFSHVIGHLDNSNFFHPSQHGFRKHFSCEMQLFKFTTDRHESFHLSLTTDAVFTDFAKAFDTVPHQRLLLKLSQLNISNDIIHWITSFLTNRQHSVTIENASSSPASVKSGVSQRSVLGQLLFLIYINDSPSPLTSSVRLFADDGVVYRRIKNPVDSVILQSDLNLLHEWCFTWQMTINTSKTKFISFNQKKSHCPSYSINAAPRSQVHVLQISRSYSDRKPNIEFTHRLHN